MTTHHHDDNHAIQTAADVNNAEKCALIKSEAIKAIKQILKAFQWKLEKEWYHQVTDTRIPILWSVIRYRYPCRYDTGSNDTPNVEYHVMLHCYCDLVGRRRSGAIEGCWMEQLVGQRCARLCVCWTDTAVCSTSTCWLLPLRYDVGRMAREAGELRGQGNTTYHFHFQALAQQVAANAFLTQSSSGYTRLLSSIVCTSQAGRRAGGA